MDFATLGLWGFGTLGVRGLLVLDLVDSRTIGLWHLLDCRTLGLGDSVCGLCGLWDFGTLGP